MKVDMESESVCGKSKWIWKVKVDMEVEVKKNIGDVWPT